jgi:predicted ATP-grasp superfamily ATP-dependent carboligase
MKPFDANRNPKQPGVVVLGAETQGLGILRLLAEHSIPTIVVDQDDRGVARFSRFCKSFLRSPRYSCTDEFVDFLLDVCRDYRLSDWALFPTDDEQVKALSMRKDDLEMFYRVWTPRWTTIDKLYRKDLFYEYARGLGLAIPKTYKVASLEMLDGLELVFPVIVKPSVKNRFYPRFRKKAIEAQNLVELRRIMERVTEVVPLSDLLIQEVIPGAGDTQFSYVTFFRDGKPITDVTARRTRQHPMNYGQASTFVETVDYPVLREISVQLLSSLDYYGVCEVEFKHDRRDDLPKLLEVNARFWGWHTLVRRCGANYPHLLYCDIYGKRPPQFTLDTRGVRWVKLITDLPIVIVEMAKQRLSLRSVLLQYSGRLESATFACCDPVPFFAEWVLAPYLLRKRGY